jgi:hypothetical protein
MECPYCLNELCDHDYFGRGIPGTRDFKKIGDIYKYANEDCSMFDQHFHTRNGDLREGYPC